MMKSVKKAIIAALCAGTLVVGSVAGTMAYLTSTDEVVNTFTVGNVAITLDETDTDNSTPSADRDQANSYKLMPGHNYTKDPIVHVGASSEDCYLFVKVKNEIAAIEGEKTVAQQMSEKGWVAVPEAQPQPGETVYVYTQKDDLGNVALALVHAGDDVTVFDNFTIKGDVNHDGLTNYEGKTITVNAYAIQADGFDDKTAAEIWAATGFGTTATN